MKTCRKGLHQFEGEYCKECKRATDRARWANPEVKARLSKSHKVWRNKPEVRLVKNEQYRIWKRADRYGLNIGDFELMFASQDNLCANDGCKASEPGNKTGWCIDHDHVTGKVRAILCHHCNVALGNAKDCKKRLLGLVKYLQLHEGTL